MELTTFQTFNVGILVLFAGRFLNRRVDFLRNYNIPEPVSGGIIASLAFALLYFIVGIETSFTLTARDALLPRSGEH